LPKFVGQKALIIWNGDKTDIDLFLSLDNMTEGMVQIQEGHEIFNYLDQFFNNVKPKKSLTLYDEKPVVLLNWTENPSQPTILGDWVNSTFRILEMNESVSDEILGGPLQSNLSFHESLSLINGGRGFRTGAELFCQEFMPVTTPLFCKYSGVVTGINSWQNNSAPVRKPLPPLMRLRLS
jgi:hypothetical protein